LRRYFFMPLLGELGDVGDVGLIDEPEDPDPVVLEFGMHVSPLLLAFSQASIEANLHSILPAWSFAQYGLLPVVMPDEPVPLDVLLWALATDTPASKAVIATAVANFMALSSLAV
jgi:hypothetical protein